MVHKVECLESQGKTVSARARKKAENILAARAFAQEAQQGEEESRFAMEQEEAISGFRPQLWHNCMGEPRISDLPWAADVVVGRLAEATGFRVVGNVNLLMTPEGVPQGSGRGFQLQHKRTGAACLVMVEKLFAEGGDGGMKGVAVDGVFIRQNGRNKSFERAAGPPGCPAHPFPLRETLEAASSQLDQSTAPYDFSTDLHS